MEGLLVLIFKNLSMALLLLTAFFLMKGPQFKKRLRPPDLDIHVSYISVFHVKGIKKFTENVKQKNFYKWENLLKKITKSKGT